jgi:hypothetical protein
MAKRRMDNQCKCGKPSMPNRVSSHNYCQVCFKREERRRERMRQWRRANHTPCVNCGERHLICLEFAHFPHLEAEKANNISSMRSVAHMERERPKVRSLCVLCHRKETLATRARSATTPLTVAQRMGRELLFKKYDGRCQCGWSGCQVRVTPTSSEAELQLMEWDHQPVCGPKLKDPSRCTVAEVAAEFSKCLPLYRPHHLAITRYRHEVDGGFSVNGSFLPASIVWQLNEEVPG